jgi:hypothetical protein
MYTPSTLKFPSTWRVDSPDNAWKYSGMNSVVFGKIYDGMNAVAVAKERFPLPSVVINCPDTPPVAYRFEIGPIFVMPDIVADPADKLPDTVADTVVIRPDTLAEEAVILPSIADKTISPVVIPFFTKKFFVPVATVPFSL